MKELDLLKKAWQKDIHPFEQVTEFDIYKMLHNKSSSVVKWILIISIIEFLFWTLTSVLFNTDDYMHKLHAENLIIYFKIANGINYVVILWFIFCFYKNYIKISTTEATKQLMKNIIKTRKTVQYYVWYNLSMITLSFFTGLVMAYAYNPKMDGIKYKIAHESNHQTLLIIVGIVIVASVVFIGLFWLFYRLLYGILLSKLKTNYKELKKIDL